VRDNALGVSVGGQPHRFRRWYEMQALRVIFLLETNTQLHDPHVAVARTGTGQWVISFGELLRLDDRGTRHAIVDQETR